MKVDQGPKKKRVLLLGSLDCETKNTNEVAEGEEKIRERKKSA